MNRGSWRLLALALAALLAAGCGGSDRLSRDEYIARLTDLRESLSEAERAVRARLGPDATVVEIQRELVGFAGVHERVAEDLADLRPPDEVRGANDLAKMGHRQLAADVRELERQLASVKRSDAALRLVERSLARSPGARQLGEAIDRFERLGIPLDN